MSSMRRKKPGAGKRLAPLDLDGTSTDTPDGPALTGKADLISVVREIQVAQARALNTHAGPKKDSTLKEILPETNEGASFEVMQLEESVNVNARRFNDMKMAADRKHAELDKLLDMLNDMHLEKQEMDWHVSGQTAEALRINRLKDEIAKVTRDMGKKAFYRAQLEHMAKRLDKNESCYDRHIAGMERALKAASTETKEVNHLVRQLEAGKAGALQAVANAKLEIEVDNKFKAKAMLERQLEAGRARSVQDWRAQTDQARAELAADARNDLDSAGERRLLDQLQREELSQEATKRLSLEQQSKVGTLEDAFNKIRHSTGVRTLDEMVDKFMGQGQKAVALEAQKTEAEAKLAEAKERFETLQRRFLEMKASGIGGTELNREEYDKIDEEILQARAALKVHGSSCERLGAVLVSAQQGAAGLSQRLAPHKGLVEQHEELNVAHTGMASLDSLHLSELRLSKMVEACGQPGAGAGFGEGGEGGEGGGGADEEAARAWTPKPQEAEGLGSNNLRVVSLKARRGREEAGLGEGQEGLAAGLGGGAGDDGFSSAGDDDDGETVIGRGMVKGRSDKLEDHNRRKLEAEARKKRLAEMDDPEDGDSKRASLRARQKQQKEAASRLTRTHGEGKEAASLDDAMEQTAVFLTSVPDLA